MENVSLCDFIGPFPNPAHGQSIATESLFLLLRARVEGLRALDVSGDGENWRRVFLHIKAVWRALSGRGTVYISLNSNKGAWLSLLLVVASCVKRRYVVLHHHSYGHINEFRLVAHFICSLVDRVGVNLVLGEAMARDLSRVYKLRSFPLVLNNSGLVDQALLVSRPPPFSGVVNIGYLSNITESKGIREVYNSCVAIRDAGKEFHLHIAGPCFDDVSKGVLASICDEFSSCVTYYGSLDPVQKVSFYGSIDIFIFPTQYINEAEPLVLLEAMAASASCVATDLGCIKNDIPSGGLVSSGEVFSDVLVSFIVAFENNPNLFKREARDRFVEVLKLYSRQIEALVEKF